MITVRKTLTRWGKPYLLEFLRVQTETLIFKDRHDTRRFRFRKDKGGRYHLYLVEEKLATVRVATVGNRLIAIVNSFSDFGTQIMRAALDQAVKEVQD